MNEFTFDEAAEAFKRLTGFLPTRYGWSPFSGLVEVDRCSVDGRLVTNSNKSLRKHRGHLMAQPVFLTFREVVLIFFGIIR